MKSKIDDNLGWEKDCNLKTEFEIFIIMLKALVGDHPQLFQCVVTSLELLLMSNQLLLQPLC